MGKHRAPGTESAAHPWLRKATAGLSIFIMTLTALGGGAVFAINGLGANIGMIDTRTRVKVMATILMVKPVAHDLIPHCWFTSTTNVKTQL
jgi:hypothetical protein